MNLKQQFLEVWQALGWLCYLTVIALFINNITIARFLSYSTQVLFWGVFVLSLIAFIICSVFYHQNKD